MNGNVYLQNTIGYKYIQIHRALRAEKRKGLISSYKHNMEMNTRMQRIIFRKYRIYYRLIWMCQEINNNHYTKLLASAPSKLQLNDKHSRNSTLSSICTDLSCSSRGPRQKNSLFTWVLVHKTIQLSKHIKTSSKMSNYNILFILSTVSRLNLCGNNKVHSRGKLFRFNMIIIVAISNRRMCVNCSRFVYSR